MIDSIHWGLLAVTLVTCVAAVVICYAGFLLIDWWLDRPRR